MTLAPVDPPPRLPDRPATARFPRPVEPAGHVDTARNTRLRDLQQAAVWGIGLRLAVVAAEFVAFWGWGYAALLVDAVASLFDVAASAAILVAIRMAAKPPDEHHPFGHGRYEPLAGLQLSVLIAVAGGWLAVRYALGLATSQAAGHVAPWAWLVPALAAVAVEVASQIVRRIGERQSSTALIAEARHYRIDALTSLVAAAGLGVAGQSPALAHHIDLASAALLAVIMVWLGLRSARENLHQLLDRVPHDERFDQVRASALQVPGVLGVEKVRIQHAGPDAHVDIDIEVDPDMPVVEAHVITQQVRAQIQADWPFVREVVVHVEPYYADDH
jgi:cation diffusion facilitator family transporter